jgi:hypothetical protein
VRPEGLCQWNIPVTPPKIEPATFQFVALCFNQLHHCVTPSVDIDQAFFVAHNLPVPSCMQWEVCTWAVASYYQLLCLYTQWCWHYASQLGATTLCTFTINTLQQISKLATKVGYITPMHIGDRRPLSSFHVQNSCPQTEWKVILTKWCTCHSEQVTRPVKKFPAVDATWKFINPYPANVDNRVSS